MINNLREFRKAKGFKQGELGELVGLTGSCLSSYEMNGGCPSLLVAYRIGAVLDAKIEDIWPNTVEVVEETIVVKRLVKDA